jgi:hypothetical protein
MENSRETPLTGVVTSRKCPTCGHHEVGITTKNGTFYPLRPGSLIQVLENLPHEGLEFDAPVSPLAESPKAVETVPEDKPWVPGPAKGYRTLRLKYGVMITESGLLGGQIDGSAYQKAYLEKLRRLIEKEIHIPLAVILDQYFSAPHLASGSPGEIAFALFHELEEIREPVEAVKTWLENPCADSANNLIFSKTEATLDETVADDETLRIELHALSLEEFLGLL